MNDNLQESLAPMLAELAKDKRFAPSKFWDDINQKNIEMLAAEGIQNFKRTVSQNYFNWMIAPDSEMFRRAKAYWRSHPSIWPLLTRIEKNISVRLITGPDPVTLGEQERKTYRLFVSRLWEIMRKLDRAGLHRRIKEPETGNPIRIWRGSRLITQDLANSIIEVNVLADLLQGAGPRPRVAEIGAGYGRVAHVYAATQPGSYHIFDIPPALHVSQSYLTSVMPGKRIFRFRSFDNFASISDELAQADIAFFSANQLSMFPPDYYDTIVSISTLPEMTPEQVAMYLELFRKLAKGHIYLKQWKSWKNPLDGTDVRVEDYLTDSNWQIVLDRTDPVVPEFFNRVWRRGA